MKYFIITGTTHGLGKSLADELNKQKNNIVLSIDRTKNFDLSKIHQIKKNTEKIFNKIDFKIAKEIYLINNAGIVEPVKTLENSTSQEIETNFQVNILAPMILSSLFMQKTKKFNGKKIILNISSGAAIGPTYGWSSYCSSKAAMNMFTACTSLEQETQKNPVTIIALAPGIIDTSMQAKIRKVKRENFIDKDEFIAYKKNNNLQSPQKTAQKIISFLLSGNYISGKYYDIRKISL